MVPSVDVHMHSEFSPCSVNTSVIANARVATSKGLKVIAITDHGVTGNPPWINRYFETIERARGFYGDKLCILTGMEVDIVQEGRLVVDRRILARLDIVIASIHRVPSMVNVADYWYRSMIRAARSGVVNVIGHPTDVGFIKARLPEEYVLEVLDVLRSNNVAIELNYHHRDPEPYFLKLAVDKGVKIVPTSDAHNLSEIGHLDWHIDTLTRIGIRLENVNWISEEELVNYKP